MEHDHYDIVVNYIIANQKKFYRLAYTYVRNEYTCRHQRAGS